MTTSKADDKQERARAYAVLDLDRKTISRIESFMATTKATARQAIGAGMAFLDSEMTGQEEAPKRASN